MSEAIIKRRSFISWFLQKSEWLRWAILAPIGIYLALNIINSKIAVVPADVPQTKTQTISLPFYVDVVEKAEIKNPAVQINRIGIDEYWKKTQDYKIHLVSRTNDSNNKGRCYTCFFLQHIAMADASATIVQYAEETINHLQTMNTWISYFPSYKTENSNIIIQYTLGRSRYYYGICALTSVFVTILMFAPNRFLTKLLNKIYLGYFKR